MRNKLKKKIVAVLIASVIACGLWACGSSSEPKEETKNENNGESTGITTEEKNDDSNLSQSEWMEQHAGEYQDGYEVVDKINIDSKDTTLEYISNEKYTLENGENVLLVNFKFTNISAGSTNVDSQYNFQCFQDGVETTVYASIYDEIEGDSNRRKEILDSSSIDVSIAISPENWESPIKLRVDDSMGYDEENTIHSYQQQEINLK